MGDLLKFIETAKGFDTNGKLKAVLFAAGLKPSTYVALKITSKNLDEKFHFERHLAKARIPFKVAKGKSFEEIDKIKGNKIIWKIKGTWYGYDLFQSKKTKDLFRLYLRQVKRSNHDSADVIGGKIYGYPLCCVRNFIKNHKLEWLKKKYTYYEYYKLLHDLDRKFPFITHTPCSLSCKASVKLNKEYFEKIKKQARKFWKAYTKKRIYTTDLIVDTESNIYEDKLEDTKILWAEKDGHDYSLISKKKIESHYYLFSHLTKKFYERGTILRSKIIVQYDYANIDVKKVVGQINDLHHERKLYLLGRR